MHTYLGTGKTRHKSNSKSAVRVDCKQLGFFHGKKVRAHLALSLFRVCECSRFISPSFCRGERETLSPPILFLYLRPFSFHSPPSFPLFSSPYVHDVWKVHFSPALRGGLFFAGIITGRRRLFPPKPPPPPPPPTDAQNRDEPLFPLSSLSGTHLPRHYQGPTGWREKKNHQIYLLCV